jgi:hypothetical protein
MLRAKLIPRLGLDRLERNLALNIQDMKQERVSAGLLEKNGAGGSIFLGEWPNPTLNRRTGLAHRTAVDAGKAVYSKSHLRLPVDI